MFIGTDITEVNRIHHLINQYKNKFLNRIFIKEELEYCYSKNSPIIHLCGTFSAKESAKKAILSSPFLERISFIDILVRRKTNGAPFVTINKNINDISKIKVSISHTNEYATSIAILEVK